MLIPMTDIVIYQQPSEKYPTRNKVFYLDFVTSLEISESWDNLTNTTKITFPQNIYFVDESGRKVTWSDENITGDPNLIPVLLKGDKVTIDLGFNYWTKGKQVIDVTPRFEGYVSGITNRLPIEIECEDNMYVLKQISCPTKLFTGKTLQEILKELMSKTEFTVNDIAKTSIGDFRTDKSETVAQVLNRLRKDYHIYSNFRGDDLQCSGLVYSADSNTRKEFIFDFQENIEMGSDDLKYQRTDDINIGIKAYSVSEFELTESNSAGKKRKKHKRLSVFVTRKGLTPEAGWDGEKRTLYFADVKSESDLIAKAKGQLNRLYYEGFKGSFRTFAIWPLTFGNIAVMRDNSIPERNGKYFIKSVTTISNTTEGLMQDVEIDLRADILSENELRNPQ
jgi:hypothetical protein